MLLLNLMSLDELKEAIDILRKELFEIASIKGFSDKRAMQISKRLELYQKRYNELKKPEQHSTGTSFSNLPIVQ